MTDGWLNPRHRAEDFRSAYARQGWVQVDDLFAPKVADALGDVLARGTPWSLVHANEAGRHAILPPDTLAAMAPESLRTRMAEVGDRAAVGFSYLYLVYPMIDAYLDGRDPGHPLNALTDFLNSQTFINFVQTITGEVVRKVDAQATLYRPGDFLTQHDDLGVGERRAAYTLSLTRGWRPDWGGQLLFHDARGDIAQGFAPRFNVLTLFRVPTLHSVAPVAPYARSPRLTVTGWLRDDPPDGVVV